MRTFIFHLAAFFTLMLPVKGAYRYSVQSGDWSQTSTWSSSTIPVCGDSVLISVSHTVSITGQISFVCSLKTVVVIKGVLHFDGGNKLTLPCDSRIYIMGGGKLDSDGGGNSNRIEICSNVLWSGSSGTLNGPQCLPSTLPGCSAVMPIELVSFEATQCGTKMCISWSTVTEINNDHFVIQKMKEDIFVDLETVNTKAQNGNSRHLLSYSVNDVNPDDGVNYYRLKQVDVDGSFSTSHIVVINFTAGKKNVEAFPNPSSGSFTLRLFNGPANVINVLNSAGTTVLTEEVINQSHYSVNGLGTGVYYCVVRSEANVETVKVEVE
jgi:hypothetical protein